MTDVLSPEVARNLSETARFVLDGKVNLNDATQRGLEIVPGIGPKLAKAIVEDRQRHGPFRRIQDIMRVKGIKEGKFKKIKESIEVKSDRR